MQKITTALPPLGITNKINEIIDEKQDKLTFDTEPTLGSTNPVTSNGIKSILNALNNSVVHVNGESYFVKSEIVEWGIPDYNASVAYPTGFTAPSNGFILFTGNFSGYETPVVYINNIEIFRWYMYGNQNNWNITFPPIPVSKGDVISMIENSKWFLLFIPAKGCKE